MKLDFKNKTYTLRNGYEYRNYCDDAGGKYPVQGAYRPKDGVWEQCAHTLNGRFFVDEDHDFDLIETKKTHTITFWANYFPDGTTDFWYSKEDSGKSYRKNRIACLKITRTFTEGEGLELADEIMDKLSEK